MYFANVSTDDILEIVAELNRDKYSDNIVIENMRRTSKNIISVKLGTRDNRTIGSRRSWSGRHGKWACTHVFEDVMREVVEREGTVSIPKGAKGNNTGAVLKINLESDFDMDAWVDSYNCSNVGSIMEPAYPEYLCVGCDED